jgi:virginiamycin B lyase
VRPATTLSLTFLAVLAGALAPSAARASAIVTSYTQGLTPGANMADVALGADGNVWFTESAAPGRIGRITPAGQITEFTAGLTANSQPTGITAGSDGAMWFTERIGARIGRITSDGTITEFALPAGSQPGGIVSGPGGDLWYADRSGRIARMTTAGAVSTYPVSGAKPEEIAVGSDGNVWFTDKGSVGRMTPLGVAVPSLASLASPTDIAAGSDGNLWVPSAGGGVARVTPLGVLDLFTAGLTPGGSPTGIVAGGAGALWFAEQNALARIDTAGKTAEFGLPATLAPRRLAVGADGALWFVAINVIGRLGFVADGKGSDGGAAGESSEVPVPKVGRAVVVQRVKGRVRVRRPRGRGYEELEKGRSIPVGSLVDTRRGSVRLTTATDSEGHTQTGVFSGGTFSIAQGRGGTTDLFLRGGSFARCGRLLKAVASTADRKRRPVRSLWGRDRSGQFRTHGRDSVATVRGTTWLTRDRCDGTLTVVRSGAVSVRDRRTHRTVVVRAGGRHLARRAAR